MLIGHAGIAQALALSRRDLPLAWLVMAAFLPDLVRLPLSAATPYWREMLSHSVPAVAFLGVAIGLASLASGYGLANASVLSIACLTHWPMDVFTGCKPLVPGVWIGLFGYRHPVTDLAVEGFLFVGAWVLLRGRRSPSSSAHRAIVPISFLVLQACFLVSMYVNAEFFVGGREWLWYPGRSWLPRERPVEHLGCHPPNS